MPDTQIAVVHGQQATVCLSGELDMARTDEVETAIRAALEDNPARLHVDMSGVTFVDSRGIRSLMVGARAAEARGVEFEIGLASEAVERVLEITGVRNVIDRR